MKRRDLEALSKEEAIKIALNSKPVQDRLLGHEITDTDFMLLKEYKGLVKIFAKKVVQQELS